MATPCDAGSLDTPRLGQKVSKEPRALTSPRALICRFRCRLLLAEIPKGCRQKLRAETATSPVGIGSNQRSDLQGPGSAQLWTAAQPQTDEQRGKRACALTARGSITKAMKGLVWWRRAGLCGLPQELDDSPHPAEFWLGNSFSPVRTAPENGPIQTGAKRDEGARLTQKQVLRRSSTSNCRQRVLLVLLADGRNTWAPSSPSQELGRRDACSGVLTFSRPSGQQVTCRKSVASCSTHKRCS